jgi:hypothetical protein
VTGVAMADDEPAPTVLLGVAKGNCLGKGLDAAAGEAETGMPFCLAIVAVVFAGLAPVVTVTAGEDDDDAALGATAGVFGVTDVGVLVLEVEGQLSGGG